MYFDWIERSSELDVQRSLKVFTWNLGIVEWFASDRWFAVLTHGDYEIGSGKQSLKVALNFLLD